MKTYLILGASSDVGMAYLKHLEVTAESGSSVFAHYHQMSPVFQDLIQSIKNLKIVPIQADLSLHEETCRLIQQVQRNCESPTHILHLPAGKFEYMRLKQFDIEKARHEMNIQVFSLAEILKVFLPLMAKKNYGKVVVMLTAYTVGKPPKFMVDYLISKHALLGLMKAAATEYEDKGLNINGLSPSMIETKFLDNIDRRIVELAASETPLKRNISKEEVIEAIDFLMSDQNGYMNGVNLNFTGGEI